MVMAGGIGPASPSLNLLSAAPRAGEPPPPNGLLSEPEDHNETVPFKEKKYTPGSSNIVKKIREEKSAPISNNRYYGDGISRNSSFLEVNIRKQLLRVKVYENNKSRSRKTDPLYCPTGIGSRVECEVPFDASVVEVCPTQSRAAVRTHTKPTPRGKKENRGMEMMLSGCISRYL